MKVKFTHQELLGLQMSINSPSLGDYEGVKFCYALNKNCDKINKECTDIRKAMALDDSLIKKLDEKEVDGKTWEDMGEFLVGADLEDAEKQKAIDKCKENVSFLSQEIEIDVHGLKITDMPVNIKNKHYKLLTPLFNEEKTE